MKKLIDIAYEIRWLLDGKKTYLVGGALVLNGLAQQDGNMVLQGLGLIFLRSGVAKA